MRTYTISALLAAYTYALCAKIDDADTTDTACEDFPEVQDAVAANLEDTRYVWQEVTTPDGYTNRMIQFTNQKSANPLDLFNDSGFVKGPILLWHDGEQDCLDWITAKASEDEPALITTLLTDLWAVWVGCKRGTKYSRPETIDDPETFWDFDTKTVAENDIITMVEQINLQQPECTSVGIVGYGLGAAEATIAASQESNKINTVVALAPCYISTYTLPKEEKTYDNYDYGHRRLSGSNNRDLHQTFMDERGRNLSSYTDKSQRSSYWDRTEQYCTYNPSACYQYCDWYPSYCYDFCHWFPEFCPKDDRDAFCTKGKVFRDNDVYELYGDDWETQVETLCLELDEDDCTALKATVDQGLKPMSLFQVEHQQQQVMSGTFDEYQEFEVFCNGANAPGTAIDLSSLEVEVRHIYVTGDDVCDVEANQKVSNALNLVDTNTMVFNPDITHTTIQGQNDSLDIVGRIRNNFNDCKQDD